MPLDRDRSRRSTPTLADYGRSIWRRKLIVLVALGGGLALGMTLLPTALANRGTQKATVPLRVGQTASDAIAEQNPAADAGKAKDDTARDQLRDVAIAQKVLDGLGPLRGDLDADKLLKGLSHTPVAGTDEVDLEYVDRSGARATAVARNYAKLWVTQRNTEDQRCVAADRPRRLADHRAVAGPAGRHRGRPDGRVGRAQGVHPRLRRGGHRAARACH